MAKLVLTIQANDKASESVQALNKEVQVLSQTLSSIKVNKDLTAQINALTKHYTALANAQSKITANANKQAIADEKLSQQQAITAKKVAEAAAAQARLEKAQQKTSNTTEQLQKKFANLLSTIKSLKSSYPQGTFDEMEQGVRENLQATKDGTKSVEDLGAAYDTLSTKVAVAKAETDKVTTAVVKSGDSIGSLAKKFLLWQVTATLVMKPLRLIQDMLSSIDDTLVKTEDAVIALQRVLPSGSATDDEVSSRLYKIAADYGQTFENVSQIATNFARTGMSWADTIKATEAAVLALNVAELDAEEATTGLIAILSQFNLKASDLETVIDKLNKTADNFPVTTEKILAALQRTGSAASNANLSLDQTIALITALSKATGRSGENIGTALNSLIQYSSKASALDTFAALSKDSADVVAQFRQGGATILDVWRQVSEEIKNLKSDQADLLDQYFATEDGEALKDALDGELEDIYTELGGVYDTANTFRKNYFIALLGNMDTVEEAMGTLGDAAGYSQKENEKYLNTYTAKLNSLKAQWQDIANSEQGILGIKKALVDVGSVLLTIIKWTGGLRTTLLAISTVVWMLVGDKIIAGFKAIGTALKGLVTGFRTATTAAQGFQAALGWIGAIATVISFIVGLVQQANEETQRLDSEALSRASEGLSTLRDNVQQNIDRFDELKRAVEEARAVLADSTSTTEEIASAQNTLATIQDTLSRSNKNYADSLDLANGELAKQLELLSQMGEANARKKVQEYLDENSDAIYNAKQYKQRKSSGIEFSEATGLWEDAGQDLSGTNSPLEGWLKSQGYDVEQLAGFWEGLGSLFSNSKSFHTTLSTQDLTQDEKIDLLEELFEKARYEENADYLQAQIREAINAIKNDETYQNVENLLSGSDNTWGAPIEVLERFVNSNDPDAYERFLKEIGLLEEEAAIEAGEWHNNIQKVTKKYDDLISKLKELRDAEKENLDLEEKKKDYLEAQNELIKAQQALENARNEATVRRFNQATGQWEWQVDEKKIAEAEEAVKKQEESVEDARKDLEEQAYDAIIELLDKEDPPTNEELIDLLDGLKDFLGDDFVKAIKSVFKSEAGVSLLDSDDVRDALDYFQEKANEFADGVKEFGDKVKPFFDNLKDFFGKTFRKSDSSLSSDQGFDQGGAAIGKGLMPKATDEIETVNDPELTAKILSPVSNAEFHRWVRDHGILFETARQYVQTPVIERAGGAIDNRVDNRGQIIMNGVKIGSDRRSSSLDENLAIAGIVPNE